MAYSKFKGGTRSFNRKVVPLSHHKSEVLLKRRYGAFRFGQEAGFSRTFLAVQRIVALFCFYSNVQ